MSERAPSAWTVQNAMAAAGEAISRLRDEHGVVLDDEADLLAALAEEGIDVATLLGRLVKATLEAKALGAAADARIEDLKVRRLRFAKREAAYRDTIADIMQNLDMRKLVDAEYSVSVRIGGQKLVIVDEAALPENYVEVTVSTAPLKAEIKAALERGEPIEGAMLSNGTPVLTIRTK